MIADVFLGHARHGDVGEFVGADAKQVALNGGRMKEYGAFFIMGHAFAQFPGRRTLHLHGPPLAVKFEPHRGRAFLAPARGAGGLHAT